LRILAIDPGNTMSAWCLLEDGAFVSAAKEPNADVLGAVRGPDDFNPMPDALAIEMIASYGMAVGREVFETCLWIGRFMEAWEARGGAVKLIYRKEVKVYHCGTVRATDANVRASLLDRYGPGRELAVGTKRAPGPLYGISGDQWSALAVALTLEAQLSAPDTRSRPLENAITE
jgi:hypothetical protein